MKPLRTRHDRYNVRFCATRRYNLAVTLTDGPYKRKVGKMLVNDRRTISSKRLTEMLQNDAHDILERGIMSHRKKQIRSYLENLSLWFSYDT